jgi:hypothetical protein
MSAKKASKTKAQTPTPSKKRTRFPRTEAVLTGSPLTEAAAEPTMEASPAEGAGGMTTVEPGQAEAVPEATAREAPTEDVGAEPPTVEGTGMEATAAGATPDAAPTQPAEAAPKAPGKGKKGRKPRATKTRSGEDGGTARKLSALDAAAKVLGEAGQAMSCKEMIAAMAAQGYWSSPAGRTPEATLYSAILREVNTRGEQARFVKAQRGRFALRHET